MEENQNVNNYDENDKEFKDIQNQYVKNAFCYVPLVAFFLYFAEKKKSPEYERHLKYGMFFFVSFILLWVILGIFLSIINNWVLNFVVLGFLFLFYIVLSAFLGYRAYNKQGVRIKILDDLLEKIFGMLNAKKKETVVDTKKDENIENSSGNLKEKVEDPFAELDKIEKN